ncbi:MAG: c-type cytochrome [Acidobacteria bacterium]|nr:c-type cytochrome [Acidobacteriota bacterium]
MHSVRRRPSAFHYALGTMCCALGIVAMYAPSGDAQQMRPLTAGVYSAAQAARGEVLYADGCASCHGVEFEGTIGPPLAGELFLSNNSALPLAAVVNRIQQTMPFNLPGSLSMEQAIDLTAYILQGGAFPAGQAALGEADLATIAFPVTAAVAPAVAADRGSLPPPEGNLAELMRGIAFPNANIIFNLQIRNPDDEPRIDVAQPFDYRQWGTTIYPGWRAVDQAAIALTETAVLYLTPGRKCQNGRIAPVERDDWKQAVADMIAVSQEAHRASKARDFDAFIDISEKLNESCDSCHRVYRDTGGVEGGIGGDRCR